MSVNRTSTNLVRFFGSQLSAEVDRAQFGNVFRSGSSIEKSIDASILRLTRGNLVPASVNIEEFHAALGFLEERDIPRIVAESMAVVFVDVAKVQKVKVMQLLDSVETSSISLVRNQVYQLINQLRDNTSKLSNASAANNNNSLISRQLKPYA